MLSRRDILVSMPVFTLALSGRSLIASENKTNKEVKESLLMTNEKAGSSHYRKLGRSGLTVSVVGLGCNFGGWTSVTNREMRPMSRKKMRSIVEAAFDAGVTLFDTADVYAQGESEMILGETLKLHRDKVVATKWGGNMRNRQDMAFGSRRYIRQSIEGSLRRLQTDYVDIYQMHWPDPRIPVAETLDILEDLVTEGKIRYAGACHLSGWQIADAHWTARTEYSQQFVAVQREYNMLTRSIEAEVIPACRHFETSIMAVVPLAGGLLTGKYQRGKPAPKGARLAGNPIAEETYDFLEALYSFAHERGRGVTDVAIGWLASQPAVASVITGASKPEHIRSNAASINWDPSAEDLKILNTLIDKSVSRECGTVSA